MICYRCGFPHPKIEHSLQVEGITIHITTSDTLGVAVLLCSSCLKELMIFNTVYGQGTQLEGGNLDHA